MGWVPLFMLDTENEKRSNQKQYVMLINDDIRYIPVSHHSLPSGRSKLPPPSFQENYCTESLQKKWQRVTQERSVQGGRVPWTILQMFCKPLHWIPSPSAPVCVHSALDGRFPQPAQVRPCYSYQKTQGQEDTLLQISTFADYFYWLATLHLWSLGLDGNFTHGMLKPR